MSCHNQRRFAVSATATVCVFAFLAIFTGCGKNTNTVSQPDKGKGSDSVANHQAEKAMENSPELASLEAQGVPRAFAERFLTAMQTGDATALIALGKEVRVASGDDARFKSELNKRAFAAQCFGEAAKLGSAEGMMLAGRCASEGFGEAVDKARAMDWFIAAGDAGIADGYIAAARLLLDGNDASVEIDTAMALIDKALAMGSTEAKYLKGSLLLTQGGDVSAALELLMQAARVDNPEAQYLLAKLYHEGNILPKDDKVAAEWAKYATDSALVRTNAYLAIYAVRGELEGAESMGDAMNKLVDAADKGNASAALELASVYTNANPDNQNLKDVATALNYAKRAFELGEPYGAFFAAWSELVLSDYDESMSWLRRGKDAGDWRCAYSHQLATEGGMPLWDAITVATKATYADYQQYDGAKQNAGMNSAD